MEAPLLAQKITTQPPSCIAACPTDPSLLVVGAYSLEEAKDPAGPQSRSGRIELYRIIKGAENNEFSLTDCLAARDFPGCAILDLHFMYHRNTLFAVCTSSCEFGFFTLSGVSTESAKICGVGKFSFEKPVGCIATAFAWDPNHHPASKRRIFAVTFSSGEVEVYEISHSAGGVFKVCHKIVMSPPRSLEAWTVAFVSDATKMARLLSGGDDSTLALHSVPRTIDPTDQEMTEICKDSRSHSAGVTAIMPIFDSPTEVWFLTGSYDEYLRLFAYEQGRFKLLSETRLGGGVWRLSLLEDRADETDSKSIISYDILASCMHAGAQIVRISHTIPDDSEEDVQAEWEVQVLAKLTVPHESMCYGSVAVTVNNFQTQGPQGWGEAEKGFIIASTSFYDRKLCIWGWKNEAA